MMSLAQISKANGPFELVEREIPEPGPNSGRRRRSARCCIARCTGA